MEEVRRRFEINRRKVDMRLEGEVKRRQGER
jgi:hypothetical protein